MAIILVAADNKLQRRLRWDDISGGQNYRLRTSGGNLRTGYPDCLQLPGILRSDGNFHDLDRSPCRFSLMGETTESMSISLTKTTSYLFLVLPLCLFWPVAGIGMDGNRPLAFPFRWARGSKIGSDGPERWLWSRLLRRSLVSWNSQTKQ